MTDDLVARLRAQASNPENDVVWGLNEAAAEIERLRVLVEVRTNEQHEWIARAERAEAERDALRHSAENARDFLCEHEGDITGVNYLHIVKLLNAAIDAPRGKRG